MKHFLERNADTVAVLGGLGLALAVGVAYFLGITQIAASFDRAINPSEVIVPSPTYNLEGAAKLDLKGLTPGR